MKSDIYFLILNLLIMITGLNHLYLHIEDYALVVPTTEIKLYSFIYILGLSLFFIDKIFHKIVKVPNDTLTIKTQTKV